MSLYLHPDSLSPDPQYGRAFGRRTDGGRVAPIHPHAVVRVYPAQATPWADSLDLFTRAPAFQLLPDADGRVELVVDFGTELEAELELSLGHAGGQVNVYASYGESLPEAEGLGMSTTNPHAMVHWRTPRAGKSRNRFAAKGFRFVRLQVFDVVEALEISQLSARTWFAFERQQGDFHCDDVRLQRVWQSSVYTTRVCSRPDSFWDGVKRDRVGWYGDARVTQLVADAAFADPEPSAQMLAILPTDSWTMGIPGYTFAAIAMLRQLILAHGLHPAVPALYDRVRTALRWAHRTQLNADGLIVRDPDAGYFGKVAFIDWSPMPVGGEFEDLSHVQCQHLEGLRMAAQIATWLGRSADAKAYTARAERLAVTLRDRFWQDDMGMLHTLNQVVEDWEPLVTLPLPITVDNDFRRKWYRLPSIGPSGPSRHSQSMAVLAGLVASDDDRRAVLRTLKSTRVPVLITAYFRYFEAVARAECGDPSGAIANMRDFVGEQLEQHDSPTLWEWYDPAVQDFRKWGLDDWPKSMCHPWGGGIVPVMQRYLFGIEILEPGFGHLRLAPSALPELCFRATVPTPRGPLTVARETPRGPLHYDLPEGTTVAPDSSPDAVIA